MKNTTFLIRPRCDVLRAVQQNRYILHIVTDDFFQVTDVMQQGFFRRELHMMLGPEYGQPEEYVSLRRFVRKVQESDNRALWEKQLFEIQSVLYLCGDWGTDGPDLGIRHWIHQYIEDRTLWEIQHPESWEGSILVIYGRKTVLPGELEEYTARIEIPPLQVEDFREILYHKFGTAVSEKQLQWYADRMSGFTEREVENLFSEITYGPEPPAVYLHGDNQAKAERIIRREKDLQLRKHGKLDFVDVVDECRGLDMIQRWLEKHRQNIIRCDSRSNDDITKGILLVGLPGTGKSMMAKKCAKILDLPLIKLEMSRILDSYLGQSEKNQDQVFEDILVAGAPCVLWIDEVEKVFAGVQSRGDSGVTARLYGKLLTFMQEMRKTVFIVATANDLSMIPREFIRPGRFSAIFALLLPSYQECISIMKEKLRHHFGTEDRLLAEDLIDIIHMKSTEDRHRFMTGADISLLTQEMCIEMGAVPGAGEPPFADWRERARMAMQEVCEHCSVCVDSGIEETMYAAAKNYCSILNWPVRTVSTEDPIFKRENYHPSWVRNYAIGSIGSCANNGRLEGQSLFLNDPQCFVDPNYKERVPYDQTLFRCIGNAMDKYLRETGQVRAEKGPRIRESDAMHYLIHD